jgi:hypothetical protein
MEAESFLWSSIQNKNISSLYKFINQYIVSVSTKNDIIEILINIYCNHLISKNIWVITYINSLIGNIDSNKKDWVKSKDICIELLSLYVVLEHNDFNVPIINNVIKERITDISLNFKGRYKHVDKYKHLLNGNIFTLFNSMFGILINKKNIYDICLIARYILDLKKSQLFFETPKNNILNIDLLFNICELDENIPEHIKKFIKLNNILFHKYIKKKNYNKRVNLLFISYDAIISRNVYEQTIELESIKKNIPINSTEFLFTIHNYDYDTIMKIEKEKYSIKNIRPDQKIVNIENCILLDERKKTVEVIKR